MLQVGNLNFHQSFKPEIQYIAAIIELANDNEFHSVQEISSLTGIPNGKSSGKVEPHIHYANFMGLIEFEKKDSSYNLTRTQLGNIIYNEDPGLQEKLTILLCHGMMLREKNGASVWSCCFKSIFPQYYSGIKKESLLKELETRLGDKITQKNVAPFYGSYENIFECLEILDNEGDNIKIKSMPYEREFVFLYALILFEYWDEFFPDQDEITSNQLEALGFKNAFGWDNKKEYDVLEHLSDKDIIRMNRQLMPYTILRLTKKEDITDQLFSELC